MKRIQTIAASLLLLAASPLTAYEVEVHDTMTRHVFNRLSADFQQRLGVARDYKIGGVTLQKLMADAAIAEDTPPRPVNHFLDPENDAPLTTRLLFGICLPNGMRADSWAENNPFSQQTLTWLPNHYEDALLGPNQGTRDASLREFFQTLGHVVHLVQDMSQPEHTRNDQHLTNSNMVLFNGTTASVWETWGLANLVEQIDPAGQPIPGTAAVDFDMYPNVSLPDYRSYFRTADRKGLANFSNLNFVTQDTNYDSEFPCAAPDLSPCYTHDFPRIDAPGTSVRVEPVEESVIDDFGVHSIKLVDEWIYTHKIADGYTGGVDDDPFHTFFSLLDMETRVHGCPVYSLGDGSYLSRASMLVPRAVGYSAGLIEHFFRGKIDVTWTEISSGSYDIKVTNQGSEKIGADARIRAVFKTDPSYFGAGSNDTGFIINAFIGESVPGFAGLDAGESVTIHGISPFGLHSGDLVTKFERRVIVAATLGSSPNEEVIGLVQPPITSKGLRAEITWPQAQPPRLIHLFNGITYGPSWAGLNQATDECFAYSSFPKTCFKNPPPPYQPLVITLDPIVPAQTYTFQIAADCCSQQSWTITTKFFLDGAPVKTETRNVRYSRFSETTFATYP
ncbi:MAG TPA: hypothetical protein VGD79_10645 [Thermoanaerobaculia bacterium]|jgi:hypothetical protein